MPHRNRVKPEKFIFARMLRKKRTLSERMMWGRISGKQTGYRFRQQSVLYGWIVDFWCPSEKVVIEIDGGYHFTQEQQEKDDYRDSVLERYNIMTLRVPVEEVYNNLDGVINDIKHAIYYGSTPKWQRRKPFREDAA